jgi:hypothetical protein
MLIIGIASLLSSKFWKPQSRKLSSVIIAICITLYAISYISVFSVKAVNPVIASCEGYFVREYRDSSKGPFTYSFVFDDGVGADKRFHLDSFSKKDIFSDDFIEGEMYQIIYEKDTRIILRVEQIS